MSPEEEITESEIDVATSPAEAEVSSQASTPVEPEARAEPAAAATPQSDPDVPSVDELEGRLGEVEQAMAHLQVGDLDDAETGIASLDQRTNGTSD